MTLIVTEGDSSASYSLLLIHKVKLAYNLDFVNCFFSLFGKLGDLFKLAVIELGIESVYFHQLVVGSLLHYIAVPHA